eukprot:scaffold18289_cov126-Isochrysis_galbana.AAC.2
MEWAGGMYRVLSGAEEAKGGDVEGGFTKAAGSWPALKYTCVGARAPHQHLTPHVRAAAGAASRP